jgi:hypothetical protein
MHVVVSLVRFKTASTLVHLGKQVVDGMELANDRVQRKKVKLSLVLNQAPQLQTFGEVEV